MGIISIYNTIYRAGSVGICLWHCLDTAAYGINLTATAEAFAIFLAWSLFCVLLVWLSEYTGANDIY
jgi:hypothetical protein